MNGGKGKNILHGYVYLCTNLKVSIEYKHIDDDFFKNIQAEKIFPKLNCEQFRLFVSIAKSKGEHTAHHGTGLYPCYNAGQTASSGSSARPQ